MDDQFLEQFEPYLIEQLGKLKAMSETYKTSAAYDTSVTIYEKFLVFINKYKKEYQPMNKANTRVEFGDLIDLDAIPRKEAENSIKKMIKDQALKIPKGKAQIVKLDKWGTFSNAVAMLKKEGSLTDSYRAQKRGNVFILRHE